jgi:hypothetical protein
MLDCQRSAAAQCDRVTNGQDKQALLQCVVLLVEWPAQVAQRHDQAIDVHQLPRRDTVKLVVEYRSNVNRPAMVYVQGIEQRRDSTGLVPRQGGGAAVRRGYVRRGYVRRGHAKRHGYRNAAWR